MVRLSQGLRRCPDPKFSRVGKCSRHGTHHAINRRVSRLFLLSSFGLCWLVAAANSAQAEGLIRSKSHFYYRTSHGVSSAHIIRRYYVRVVHPSAAIDPRLDPRLRQAATIAQERANARTKARCWRSVKEALLQSGVVSSYPRTVYAYQAGQELVQNYGFKRLPIRDPYKAPIGAVIVYGSGSNGAGHVELRTKEGFVSDYKSKNKCYYPLLAVYGKFSS